MNIFFSTNAAYDPEEEVEIYIAGVVEKCKRKEFVPFARDAICMPRGKKWPGIDIAYLKVTQPREGEKIKIVSFQSKENCVDGAPVDDVGEINRVDINIEGFYHTASTTDGFCGSPIINTQGKVVGVHRATTGTFQVATSFSTLAVTVISGSTLPTFQVAPSHL